MARSRSRGKAANAPKLGVVGFEPILPHRVVIDLRRRLINHVRTVIVRVARTRIESILATIAR